MPLPRHSCAATSRPLGGHVARGISPPRNVAQFQLHCHARLAVRCCAHRARRCLLCRGLLARRCDHLAGQHLRFHGLMADSVCGPRRTPCCSVANFVFGHGAGLLLRCRGLLARRCCPLCLFGHRAGLRLRCRGLLARCHCPLSFAFAPGRTPAIWWSYCFCRPARSIRPLFVLLGLPRYVA